MTDHPTLVAGTVALAFFTTGRDLRQVLRETRAAITYRGRHRG